MYGQFCIRTGDFSFVCYVFVEIPFNWMLFYVTLPFSGAVEMGLMKFIQRRIDVNATL